MQNELIYQFSSLGLEILEAELRTAQANARQTKPLILSAEVKAYLQRFEHYLHYLLRTYPDQDLKEVLVGLLPLQDLALCKDFEYRLHLIKTLERQFNDKSIYRNSYLYAMSAAVKEVKKEYFLTASVESLDKECGKCLEALHKTIRGACRFANETQTPYLSIERLYELQKEREMLLKWVPELEEQELALKSELTMPEQNLLKKQVLSLPRGKSNLEEELKEVRAVEERLTALLQEQRDLENLAYAKAVVEIHSEKKYRLTKLNDIFANEKLAYAVCSYTAVDEMRKTLRSKERNEMKIEEFKRAYQRNHPTLAADPDNTVVLFLKKVRQILAVVFTLGLVYRYAKGVSLFSPQEKLAWGVQATLVDAKKVVKQIVR